jgi:hypothetical protein
MYIPVAGKRTPDCCKPDMHRICALAVALLLAPVNAMADIPVQDVTPSTADAPPGPVTLVNTALFLKTHPRFTLYLNSFSPEGYTRGQIPYFGGPLQYYLNTGITYTLRNIILPFGGSGILSLAHGRVEVFGSAGGTFVPIRSALPMPNAWLTQVNLGVRVALDQGRHFWIGGTAGYSADFADKNRQWGSGSADFTFQFGR